MDQLGSSLVVTEALNQLVTKVVRASIDCKQLCDENGTIAEEHQ